jgi:hypothetical protein
MSFWTNNYKPQQKHKFRLVIGDDSNNQIVWYAKSVDLPKFDVTYDRDLAGNQYINSQATAQWQPLTVQLYDHSKYIIGGVGTGDLGLSAGKLTLATLVGQKSPKVGSLIHGGLLDFTRENQWLSGDGRKLKSPGGTVTEAAESPYGRKLGNVRIQKFVHSNRSRVVSDGSLGTRIAADLIGEEWVLQNPQIVACDWGDLDAASEEINTINITFIFKNAYLQTLNLETQ